MNSFLPVPQLQTKEIDAIHEKLSENSEALQWPTINDAPLSEFSTSFLAIFNNVFRGTFRTEPVQR